MREFLANTGTPSNEGRRFPHLGPAKSERDVSLQHCDAGQTIWIGLFPSSLITRSSPASPGPVQQEVQQEVQPEVHQEAHRAPSSRHLNSATYDLKPDVLVTAVPNPSSTAARPAFHRGCLIDRMTLGLATGLSDCQ